MVKGLATIILPIYNVEKYLDRCINSVVNQTYKKLEIILVDDGSPDRCPQMCEEWAKKDNRIKVIHKENAGLGMARNTGIENANGEYIFFIDSDDYVALNMVEKVFQIAKRTSADMIMFGNQDIDRNGRTINIRVPQSSKEYYENEAVQSIILPSMVVKNKQKGAPQNLGMSAWERAYSCALIQRTAFRFVSERKFISEDVYSLLCLMKDVHSVAIIPEVFYFYCENDVSLTHTYRGDRYPRIKELYIACVQKCDELEYEPVVKEQFAYVYIGNTIGAMKLIVRSDLSVKEKREKIAEIVHDELMQKIIHQVNVRNEGNMRKLLFSAIKAKQSGLVYLMVRAKT